MPAARALALALSAALAAAATPASSAKAGSNTPALERFQAQQQVEQRVQDIGWRLVTGNSRFCDNVVPAIGLLLHDMASYREPAAVRNLLGLESDFAVLAAAEGSPAAKAGLAAGVEIAAIDNEVLSSWPSETHGDWRRTVRAHDLISARLATSGVVVLQRREGSRVKLAGEPACASRFEMGGGGKGALAEGMRVIVERDFPGLGYPEDELAAALAHELAHNLLRHRMWLEREGRGRRNIRLTEREADRLMPWLLANAGYQPSAASRFMARWGPDHSGGIFRKRSHDGWDERLEFIEAELVQIDKVRHAEGSADWHSHFRRDIDPDQ